MKLQRLGYSFLILSLAGLLLIELLRVNRERGLLREQFARQAESIEAGLRDRWRRHLLEAGRKGSLEKTFELRFAKAGGELLTPFFPVHEVTLDWQAYRQAKAGKRAEEQKSFLRRALALPRSWDRALALAEWRKELGELPEEGLRHFELASVSPEAHEAFRRVLRIFASGRDFSFASSRLELEDAFFRSTGTGEIEAFLPSKASVQPLLAGFAAGDRLGTPVLGETALDISFPELAILQAPGVNVAELLLLALALLLLAAGIGLLALGFRAEKRALARRVTFLNQLVHELKTPLAGLKLHAQLALGSGGNRANLAAIDESAARLDRLFDEIVQVNRPFRAVELQPISGAELLALLEQARKQFPDTALPAGPLPPVLGEAGRLRLILRNLLSNAVKYGTRAHVEVAEENGGVSIRVRDEGPGVPAAEAGHIFEEFYRADSARASSVDGLGIGLSLAAKLASELGASLVLENPGEAGACFLLKLRKGKS